MNLIPSVTRAKSDAAQLAPQAVESAAQEMWLFYRDHKLKLITDIKGCRAGVLAQLTAGVAVDDVFAPFFEPAEPAERMRQAA